jgi:hypothetical protein
MFHEVTSRGRCVVGRSKDLMNNAGQKAEAKGNSGLEE